MERRILAHLRSNLVAYVALFSSLGLGTAWAIEANSVKSKHIKDDQVKSVDVRDDTLPGGGLGGADVAPDSLGGGDIDESSLGPVPTAENAQNAQQLGGVGPDSYTRGDAEIASNRITIAAGSPNSHPIVSVPGMGSAYASCSAAGAVALSYFNPGDPIFSVYYETDGGAVQHFNLDSSNATPNIGATTGYRRVLFQVSRETEAQHELGTVTVFARGGDPCVAQGQAVSHTIG